MKQTLTIALPADYRADDVLAFHGRDPQQISEQVSTDAGTQRIRKGVVLDGLALELDVTLDGPQARCSVDIDGAATPAITRQLDLALRGMLGLRIDPAPFLQAVADDPLLGPLVARQRQLRVVQSASVFEALTWAIIGQQINLPFAIALRRTFIEQADRRHGGGLWCYPQAADVARLDVEQLTSRKFSRAKAETLLRLATLVDSGALELDDDDIDRASAALLAVKGIGPWTVNYTLLRGYGYADCSLHGDVAMRTALQRLLGEAEKPDIARTETLLAAYRPHRTMRRHLWASLALPARSDDDIASTSA